MTSLTYLNPPEVLQLPILSQAVIVNAGRLLLLSGQVALDAHGSVVGVGDLRAQFIQALTNVSHILTAAGSNWQQVVKMTIYVVQFQPDIQRPLILDVLRQFIDLQHPPANTLLGIHSLARQELLVEVDVVARL